MELGLMNLCATCRYFQPDTRCDAKGWSTCQHPNADPYDGHMNRNPNIMVKGNGYEDVATISVRHDFGCVMWKGK